VWGRFWRRFLGALRRDFFAGLLVFVPVGFTVLGVLWIVDRLDQLVLPNIFRALGVEVSEPRFLGAAVTLGVILLAGALTRSFVGRAALRLWERAVDRIPVARSLYMLLKQFMEAVVGDGATAQSFDRVVLIEYPRKGIYTYAFVTGTGRNLAGVPDNMLKVFISSTPNPTTGYFLLIPADEAIETGLSVEEAFKLIISAGIADSSTNGGEAAQLGEAVDPSSRS
jgi:uncharacterized membrane protein